MISYAPCTSLARVTADEGEEKKFSNASSRAAKGVNVQFFIFICKNADAITHDTTTLVGQAARQAHDAVGDEWSGLGRLHLRR